MIELRERAIDRGGGFVDRDQQTRACGVEHQIAADAVEELMADRILELADRAAERATSDVEDLRRGREMLAFSHRSERRQPVPDRG